mmetsp:Transcript_24980/g.87055  ORF Transcript_24980/g.87055 Transcript_24980/m.87055 type:complete len:222 (+) Transcript_24980:5391-6056(+)
MRGCADCGRGRRPAVGPASTPSTARSPAPCRNASCCRCASVRATAGSCRETGAMPISAAFASRYSSTSPNSIPPVPVDVGAAMAPASPDAARPSRTTAIATMGAAPSSVPSSGGASAAACCVRMSAMRAGSSRTTMSTEGGATVWSGSPPSGDAPLPLSARRLDGDGMSPGTLRGRAGARPPRTGGVASCTPPTNPSMNESYEPDMAEGGPEAPSRHSELS